MCLIALRTVCVAGMVWVLLHLSGCASVPQIPSWLKVRACYTTKDGTKVCGGVEGGKAIIDAEKKEK